MWIIAGREFEIVIAWSGLVTWLEGLWKEKRAFRMKKFLSGVMGKVGEKTGIGREEGGSCELHVVYEDPRPVLE